MKLIFPCFIAATFITVTMTMNTFSLMLAIAVLWFYHHSPDIRVPSCLRVVIIQFLGCLVCFRKPNRVVPEQKQIPRKLNEEAMNIQSVENDIKSMPPISNPVELPAKLDELVDHMLEKRKEDERLDKNREEWETVAMVIDRFCLFIYYGVLMTAAAITFILMGISD